MVFYERRTLGGFHTAYPIRARFNPRIRYAQYDASRAVQTGAGIVLGAALLGTVASVI